MVLLSFAGGASGKEPACQCRRQKRQGFNSWVGKISWCRAWQSTPVFLPGESHEQRKPGRLQSMGSQRVGHDWSDLACTQAIVVLQRVGTLWTNFLECLTHGLVQSSHLVMSDSLRPHGPQWATMGICQYLELIVQQMDGHSFNKHPLSPVHATGIMTCVIRNNNELKAPSEVLGAMRV